MIQLSMGEQRQEINKTISRTNGLYERWARKHGINYNALLVLYYMDEFGPCSQQQICRAWLLPKQTVNTILAGYKKKGYVEFETDSSDRRGKIVKFTQQGTEYAHSLLIELYRIEERALAHMGEELCAQYISGNQKYCECFEHEVGYE